MASAVPGTVAAQARPARLILLRHGEKKSASELCSVGKLRAEALCEHYLGKGAPGNVAIFGEGQKPDAFFAITAHTQETAAPSAQSWGQELKLFPVPPHDPNQDADLNAQTRMAADKLNSPDYDGKIVVVVWEHKHIADRALNASGVTLWSLLDFGAILDVPVPDTWEGVNYDFFWIVDYTLGERTFLSMPQQYDGDQASEIPDNAWGVPVDETKFPKFYQDCKSNGAAGSAAEPQAS